MPSPGRQVSEMTDYEHCCGWVGLGGVWHLIDLPWGYHTAARGQSQTTHAPVVLRAASGLSCGWAAPGSSYVSVKGFGVVSSSGCDGQGLERVHRPRCARLRRFRVDPPSSIVEAAGTTRTGRV